MLFVTVGTTMPFDTLIEKIDTLARGGVIAEEIVCQIGNGSYVPEHCEYFRFKPNLDEDIRRADLVIGHGGTGTVLGLLAKQKQFIAVVNPMGAHDHQAQFLDRLSRSVSILWTRDLEALPELIEKARDHEIESLEGMHLADDLKTFLDGI